MAEATPAESTSVEQPKGTEANDNSVSAETKASQDMFFGDKDPFAAKETEASTGEDNLPLDTDSSGDDPNVNDSGEEVTYQGDEKVTDDPRSWYDPGVHKTRDDAIRNSHKRMAGISQQLGELGKKLDQKSKQPDASHQVSGNDQDINPETGKPHTKQEKIEKWNDYFREDPVNAQLAWNEMMSQAQGPKQEAALMNKIMGQLTWGAFLSNNPEMNTEENTKAVKEVLFAFPLVAKQPNAFMIAKDVVLSQGDTLLDKYNNWVRSQSGNGKKPKIENGNPAAPAQMPGQSNVSKGGGRKASPHPFFDTKSGESIFNYSG